MHKLGLSILLLVWMVTADTIVKQSGDCDQSSGELRCRYACGPEQLQPMCVTGKCYCTNVGMGSCKSGSNNDGCITVCQSLGKSSRGCFEGECNCE